MFTDSRFVRFFALYLLAVAMAAALYFGSDYWRGVLQTPDPRAEECTVVTAAALLVMMLPRCPKRRAGVVSGVAAALPLGFVLFLWRWPPPMLMFLVVFPSATVGAFLGMRRKQRRSCARP